VQTQTMLILQGGGALGAYECGAYQALAPHLPNLAVVAGTSIGAINASLIAHHYHDADHGAGFLRRFWTEILATPSHSFPLLAGAGRRWDAVWTSILRGHPHLYTPRLGDPFAWVFRPPVSWSETHFYTTQAMEETLHRYFEPYGSGAVDPRLIVTAVDIEEGKSRAFDSYEDRITAEHVVASGSLPPGFPAKEIKGKHYWDGGLWSNTPLPEVLNAMQKAGPMDERYHVYIIDVFPKQRRVPQTNWEVWQRITEITYADKTTYDSQACKWLNQYIDLVKTLQEHADQLPTPLRNQIEQKYTKICQEKRVHLDITIITRSAFPDEQAESISREIDFSPPRIEELMKQGYQDAKQTLDKEKPDEK
jgi:predicted acylesterase/phospholipase RssA